MIESAAVTAIVIGLSVTHLAWAVRLRLFDQPTSFGVVYRNDFTGLQLDFSFHPLGLLRLVFELVTVKTPVPGGLVGILGMGFQGFAIVVRNSPTNQNSKQEHQKKQS